MSMIEHKEYFVAKNVANMMTEPDPDSALDSQAIAGTLVKVEKEENGYCYVQTPDLYHGWISQKRLVPVWDTSKHRSACVRSLFAAVYAEPDRNSLMLSKLVIGTRIFLSQEVNEFLEIILPNQKLAYVEKSALKPWGISQANEGIFQEKWHNSNDEQKEEIIANLGKYSVQTAKLFMGTPYLWGGCTPFGLDCSGLTQLVYKLNGVQLLRDSYQQYDDKRFIKIEEGKALDQAAFQAGDLLFFAIKSRGKIDHVGIACGDSNFIQSRGEMLDGGMVINQCSMDLYKETYCGAVRLSHTAEIDISNA